MDSFRQIIRKSLPSLLPSFQIKLNYIKILSQFAHDWWDSRGAFKGALTWSLGRIKGSPSEHHPQ
jgi:hypothetical protein